MEHELSQPPTDGISSLSFAHSSNFLLSTSWDKTVRLYEPVKDRLLHKYEHKAPVLDCAFGADDANVFSGSADCSVVMLDLEKKQQRSLGSHSAAVRCILFAESVKCLLTGSWDKLLKSWDPRAENPLVGSFELPGKAYTMDQKGHLLIVGTSERHIVVYDVRKLDKPMQKRDSSLQHQTRCIRISNDLEGFALGSIEGRVAVEFFDLNPEVQKKKYAFKCHRASKEGVQMLYPVNTIAFHPKFGTFGTGGSDGVVNVWDGKNKKRICQYPKYPTSVAAMEFNHDGTLFAVASSYCWEQGERDHPADSIFIRKVNEHEVKPKPRK